MFRQTLLFVAMHYRGITSLEVKGRWGLLLLASSSQQSSNQGLPILHLDWSIPLWVSSGCAGPPSPTAPVLYHGLVRWSPPIGWWFSHACSCTAEFSISPLSQASQCSFSLISNLRLVSPNKDKSSLSALYFNVVILRAISKLAGWPTDSNFIPTSIVTLLNTL